MLMAVGMPHVVVVAISCICSTPYSVRSNNRVPALLMVVTAIDVAHELGAGLGVGAEHTMHGRGDHPCVGLLDAAHHRAQVDALGYYRHANRFKGLVDKVGDLDGHAFLDLQPPREHL